MQLHAAGGVRGGRSGVNALFSRLCVRRSLCTIGSGLYTPEPTRSGRPTPRGGPRSRPDPPLLTATRPRQSQQATSTPRILHLSALSVAVLVWLVVLRPHKGDDPGRWRATSEGRRRGRTIATKKGGGGPMPLRFFATAAARRARRDPAIWSSTRTPYPPPLHFSSLTPPSFSLPANVQIFVLSILSRGGVCG